MRRITSNVRITSIDVIRLARSCCETFFPDEGNNVKRQRHFIHRYPTDPGWLAGGGSVVDVDVIDVIDSNIDSNHLTPRITSNRSLDVIDVIPRRWAVPGAATDC